MNLPSMLLGLIFSLLMMTMLAKRAGKEKRFSTVGRSGQHILDWLAVISPRGWWRFLGEILRTEATPRFWAGGLGSILAGGGLLGVLFAVMNLDLMAGHVKQVIIIRCFHGQVVIHFKLGHGSPSWQPG